jgi:hypothetical protein
MGAIAKSYRTEKDPKVLYREQKVKRSCHVNPRAVNSSEEDSASAIKGISREISVEMGGKALTNAVKRSSSTNFA